MVAARRLGSWRIGAWAPFVFSLACTTYSGPPPSSPTKKPKATPATPTTSGPSPKTGGATAKPKAPRDPVTQIASHGNHTCGVKKSGGVLCWGRNSYGQLGGGGTTDSSRPVNVSGLSDVVQVATGIDFSCARRKNGSVKCWGNNSDGQLGDGRGGTPKAKSASPVPVKGISDAVELVTGDYHACVRRKSGGVSCWGNAEHGQLGDTSSRVFTAPKSVPGVSGVSAVSSGASHVCAVKGGKVLCWGRNTEGQLGAGDRGSRANAKPVSGISDARTLISGHRHTCAVRRTGAVMCWGDNASGQLAKGGSVDKAREPVALSGISKPPTLVGGGGHGCAQDSGGRVRCWGDNGDRQVGPGGGNRVNAPAVVRGLSDVKGLALGEAHSCALRASGSVNCWGRSKYGALGPRPLTGS